MASPSQVLVSFLLLSSTLILASTNPQNSTDGAVGMDTEELMGLFEVVGALLDDPDWAQMHPYPCTDTPWPGIQCEVGQEPDSMFHVTKIHVGPDVATPACKSSPKLSQSILKLPYLKVLSIFNCFLTTKVSLPSYLFGASSSLEQLVVKSNPGLSEGIPTTLAEVATLRVLSLSQNSFYGGVPKELGDLSRLEQLDLSYNHLTGEIPLEIGGLTSLTIFDLSWNGLQGQVPCSLGQLQSLQKVDLSSNRLVGRVPSDIGKLNKMVLLDLSHNLIEGPIPEALSGLKELEYLVLEDNPINTGVPLFIGKLGKLTVLSLSGCEMTGSIPTALSSLGNLTTLSLDRNKLTGAIPSSLGSLPHLGQLNLSQNRLSGEISFPVEFVSRLGKRLDVGGNSGFCTTPSLSHYFDAPACSSSAKSHNRSWDEKHGRGTDDKRLKPSWYDGNRNSNASVGTQRVMLLWCFSSILIVILMGFLC
ncbi:hypothetical protein MRB53_024761 [Persea americana]|uniref:Uncharacterized protein n=1 Tax=Persea americana TaxID=3435 RepID=A0ACC2LEB6_PERAE|nr:hypothetical protein MRB53_024761 [Persea americana]